MPCKLSGVSPNIVSLLDDYILYVENGNTPLVMMPPHFRDVAQIYATVKWKAETKRINEMKNRNKSREMLAKAGIPL